MKANQFSKDNEAQVGIGTMIVFIATILVAAVAAGVLIDTSQKLQAKSTQTGNAATEQVGNLLEFQVVYGKIDSGEGTATTIDRLEIWVELAAGSGAIDLADLVIQYRTSSGTTTYTWEDGVLLACATCFDDEFDLYQQDGSTAATDQVLLPGERNMILLGFDSGGEGNTLGLTAGTDVSVELLPAVGTSVSASFSTPATYQGSSVFELF